MFILSYVAKGTNLSLLMQQYAAVGYGLTTMVFSSEKAARERASSLNMQYKNAYDFYLGELTMAAASPPPPALEFKKIS